MLGDAIKTGNATIFSNEVKPGFRVFFPLFAGFTG
jgi:hypothetical protein